MDDPDVLGRKAEQSDALDHAARIGLVAYGVVHLLIASLAVQLALGDNENASAQGALAALARQPFGQAMVWAVAIGLYLLVLWRALEAGFGHREEDGGDRWRQRAGSVLKAVIYGALGVTATRVAISDGGSGGGGSKGTTAKLMDLPGGQWLVVAAGLAVLGYAGRLVWRGWTEDFADHLDTEGKLGWSGSGYLLLGRIGYVAKGIALAIVAGLFCYAGVTHEADKSGGLDQALQKVLEQPFGPYLLLAMAAGIGCFGLYCFARARHLDR